MNYLLKKKINESVTHPFPILSSLAHLLSKSTLALIMIIELIINELFKIGWCFLLLFCFFHFDCPLSYFDIYEILVFYRMS